MSSSPIDQRLQRLEHLLENLKVLYEQYFSGLLRREPSEEHKAFTQELRSVSVADLPTAPYKFRYRNIKAKHQSFSRLWERTVQEIEEGRFRRDQFKRNKIENNIAPPPPKEGHKAIEKLYQTLVTKLGTQKKIPAREKFFSQMEAQLTKFKEKNPDAKFQFKVSKGETGALQIKIQKKS